MIAVTCPGCGKVHKAKDEFAGKTVRCPNCGEEMSVLTDDMVASFIQPPGAPTVSGNRPIAVAPTPDNGLAAQGERQPDATDTATAVQTMHFALLNKLQEMNENLAPVIKAARIWLWYMYASAILALIAFVVWLADKMAGH